MSLIEIAQVNEVPTGTMKSYSVEGKQILISNIDGNFYAINNICTHAGGELSKGKLEGKIVTCPNHSSKLIISGPKIVFFTLKCKDETIYEVKVEENKIKVNIA